jgi:hypothetical protein
VPVPPVTRMGGVMAWRSFVTSSGVVSVSVMTRPGLRRHRGQREFAIPGSR